MKRNILGFLSFVLTVTPSFAALKQGDTAPDFKTQASLAGKEFTFSLRDALKKGPVVVYFYPAAFTGGCNLQAHTFGKIFATIGGVAGDANAEQALAIVQQLAAKRTAGN
jgi:peroxiredoxin